LTNSIVTVGLVTKVNILNYKDLLKETTSLIPAADQQRVYELEEMPDYEHGKEDGSVEMQFRVLVSNRSVFQTALNFWTTQALLTLLIRRFGEYGKVVKQDLIDGLSLRGERDTTARLADAKSVSYYIEQGNISELLVKMSFGREGSMRIADYQYRPFVGLYQLCKSTKGRLSEIDLAKITHTLFKDTVDAFRTHDLVEKIAAASETILGLEQQICDANRSDIPAGPHLYKVLENARLLGDQEVEATHQMCS
jgi:hypothetical protein